jgi:uncharacterized protein
MTASQQIIDQTRRWIKDVVVGCNFCPFAANAIKQHTVHYQVEESNDTETCLESLLTEAARLDNDVNIETIFLIFPNTFQQFDNYLNMVSVAEKLLKQKGYEGIYQLASFHPLYLFADSLETDAANYTNRSIFPMLHLLRETSIDKVLEHYNHPEKIPDNNIQFARKKGLTYMKMLRDTCVQIDSVTSASASL